MDLNKIIDYIGEEIQQLQDDYSKANRDIEKSYISGKIWAYDNIRYELRKVRK
jgi:hypothetical protein